MREKRERFPWIPTAKLSEAQRPVAERLVRSTNGRTGGPSGLLLRTPAAADHLNALIRYLLTESPLARRLAELAILIQARLWDQEYEWWAHEHLALQHGVGAATIADLAVDRRPVSMQPDEAATYDFCMALSRDKIVDDALFERVRVTLGETALADLTVLCGTYAAISMVLCVSQARVDPDNPLPTPGG